MHQSEILFEPLPVGRIGIRRDDQEVVIAKDFSCFAYMLEEYISLGAINIIIPKSAPEAGVLDQMPSLLKQRIKVIDDSKEIEAVERLLHKVRGEFGVKLINGSELDFPKKLSLEITEQISMIHGDVKRLALGFNNGIQVGIDAQRSMKALRGLRRKLSDAVSRLILSQIEAIFKHYENVGFNAPVPSRSTPKELISIFDRLVNDSGYIAYSDSVTRLSNPATRKRALVDLRVYSRKISSLKFISTSWDYVSKILQVWTGVPIPDSKELSSIVADKTLPALIDLSHARKSAVEMWLSSNATKVPLRRDGLPVTDDDIHWLPPFKSMEVSAPDDKAITLCKVGELKGALEEAEKHLERRLINKGNNKMLKSDTAKKSRRAP
jgi:hypothetical protein